MATRNQALKKFETLESNLTSGTFLYEIFRYLDVDTINDMCDYIARNHDISIEENNED